MKIKIIKISVLIVILISLAGIYLIKDGYIYGRKTGYASNESNEKIVLGPRDKNNPLSVRRIPISKYIYDYADELLKDKEKLSDHEKIIIFMDSMKDYNIGMDSLVPEITIKDKIGHCGSFANVLVALATTQNLESRIIEMANYPKDTGHVVVEIKINNKWCLYDPTYSAYYTTTPDNNKNPYILSLEELRAGNGRNKNVEQIINFKSRVTSDLAYEYLKPDIYENANPIGVIGPETKRYYPLSINWEEDREITIEDGFGTKYQGAEYLGAAGTNNSQVWNIINLEVGKEYTFKISGTSVNGELMANGMIDLNFRAYANIENGEIKSGGNYIFNIEQGQKEWIIKFKAKKNQVKLTLSHDYIGPDYHYVNIDKYELSRGTDES